MYVCMYVCVYMRVSDIVRLIQLRLILIGFILKVSNAVLVFYTTDLMDINCMSIYVKCSRWTACIMLSMHQKNLGF